MTTIPPDYEDADPGLARVRTSLAWTRTALSFAAVGAVALRKDVIAGLLILAAAPVIWRLGRLDHHLPGPDPARHRDDRGRFPGRPGRRRDALETGHRPEVDSKDRDAAGAGRGLLASTPGLKVKHSLDYRLSRPYT
jgi:hypothetical protein